MDGLGIFQDVSGRKFHDMRWRRVGSGLEGSIEVGCNSHGICRRKTYCFESEFRRFVIRSLLLSWAITEYGYSDLLRTADIIGFDRNSFAVISEYIRRSEIGADRCGLSSAKNAAIALAGRVDALNAMQQREILAGSKHAHAVTLLPCPGGGGFDINDGNWVFDGAMWVLIDL